MKKLIILLLITMLLLSSTVFAQSSTDNSTNIVKEKHGVSIDPHKLKDIKFDDTQIDSLPKYTKDFYKNKKGKLVGSIATVYILKDNGKGKYTVSTQYGYDFSNVEDISKYNAKISELKANDKANNKKETVSISSVKTPPDQFIVVGLNVDSFSDPNFDVNYQLQGWWSWDKNLSVGYEAINDTLGLTWTGGLYNYLNTDNAFANEMLYGYALNDPVVIKRNANSGVLWDHNNDQKSTGAALAQIQGGYTGTPFDIYFSYYENEEPYTTSDWSIEQVLNSYLWWIDVQPITYIFQTDPITRMR